MLVFYMMKFQITDIEHLQRTCSPAFVFEEFSGFLSHPCIFSNQRFQVRVNNIRYFI